MNKRRLLGWMGFYPLSFILFTLSFILSPLHAQTLTLEECKQRAHDNYPAIVQYGLVEKSRDLTLSNAAKAWLPGVSVTGFGVAMTDVMESIPAFGEMKNTMYGASLSVNQVLYDGGAISAQRKVARAKAEVEERQLDVQLYHINERVEQLYFGILMIDEQMKQVQLLQDNLELSEKTVRSMMEGGLANQSDLDQVQVNQVQADQQLLNLQTMRKAYAEMLGYFVAPREDRTPSLSPRGGMELKIEKPVAILFSSNSSISDSSNSNISDFRSSDSLQVSVTSSPRGGREGVTFALYSAQSSLLSAQRKAINAQWMPKVSLFGMAGYHSKLISRLKENNLMAGLTLNWNIGALYTRRNDLASLATQQAQIEAQQETFLFNNRLQQRQSNGQLESLQRQLELDDRAVALRESILAKARHKVESGTETVNELLRDVNAVSEARQQKAIHEILLLQESYRLNYIQNQ